MENQSKVVLNRKFNCSATELFDWLVKPALISQWFGPEHFGIVEVKTDVQVGGKYSFELKKPDQSTFLIFGEYTLVEKPLALSFTLDYSGLNGNPPSSVVHMRLEALGNKDSTLHLIQEFEFKPTDLANRTGAWEYMFMVLNNMINRPI